MWNWQIFTSYSSATLVFSLTAEPFPKAGHPYPALRVVLLQSLSWLEVPGTIPHASRRWWWSTLGTAFSKKSLSQLPFLFVVVQWLSHVPLLATPWSAACQASLSFTISWNLLRLMSLELVMPSNHVILCCPLLLTPSIYHLIFVPLPFSPLLVALFALSCSWPSLNVQYLL